MADGSVKPKIIYFPVRGRAEHIKIALAAAGVEFEFEAADFAQMKADLDHYHFGVVPRYIDGEVDMCESYAILRHLGRKHDLYGKGRKEQARVDEAIEGAIALATALWHSVIMKKDEEREAGVEKFWAAHMDPASETGKDAHGAHGKYLSRLLAQSKSGFFVDSGVSIADCILHQMVEMTGPFYEEKFEQAYPEWMEHFERVNAIPGVRAYLKSPQRLPKHSGMVPNRKADPSGQ